jgi:multidrug efflux system outer membrane protein
MKNFSPLKHRELTTDGHGWTRIFSKTNFPKFFIRVYRCPSVIKYFCLHAFVSSCLILFLAGCAVGPNYKRPPVAAPEAFRGETEISTNSFANLPWWRVFHDDTLQSLIHLALTNNYDLRIAVTRVEQARAVAAQARSQFFPQLNYALLAGRGQNVANNQPSPTGTRGTVFGGDANASWEIDLWGRLRRLNESARAQFLASQEARRDVTISLIAQVAQDYFQLLALDSELEIARQSTNSFGESLKIFNQRLQGGVASKLETSSAEALMDASAATIPQLEQQIALQENQLSVLLGQNPGAVLRGNSSLEKQIPPEVPAGLPSALLERRPDIREAEQQLRSANAQVGVAKADFFPQLNLTGLFGGASPELAAFSSGGADVAWSIAAGLTGPLFHGGQLRAQYAQARAAREQSALQYQAAVLNAFQEISGALISREKMAAARTQQSRAVAAYKTAVKISMERYRMGNADYYEVLQEQQLLFPAENTLVQFQLNQLLAVVQLYRSLGGGWKVETTVVK